MDHSTLRRVRRRISALTAALCMSRSAVRGASDSLTPAAGQDLKFRAAAAAITCRARKVTSAPNVSRTMAAPGRSLFGSLGSNSAHSWAGYTGKDSSGQREKTLIGSAEEGLRMILDMDVVYLVCRLLLEKKKKCNIIASRQIDR